jgi:hypothetical protein
VADQIMTATDYSERRQHVRVYFDGLDELRCRFAREATAPAIHAAAVHDLSLGGLHLSLEEDGGFAVGGHLTLLALSYRTGQVCDMRVDMVIRWIFARPGFSRIYLGCQFLDLADPARAWMTALVTAKERAAAGQSSASGR